MALRLKQRHLVFLIKESRKIYPIEACAILFGYASNGNFTLRKIVVTPNKLQSTKRFEIDAEIAVKTITEAEKNGLEFIGLFHSHPAPAKPSRIDSKYMKLWGDSIWLILSSIDNNLAAYQIKNRKMREITLIIE